MGPGRTTIFWRSIAGAITLIACAVFASGCGSSAESANADPNAPIQRGGTLTIGMDQEPQCLNSMIQCGSMAATSLIMSSVFDGMLKIDADGHFAPLIATEVPTRENGLVKELPGGGLDVTLHMNDKAKWSDDTPITCADVKFNFKTEMDDRWMITSRKGWDLVDSVECPDSLTAVYHFKERYAPYLGVVASAPLPEHVLAGKDFNTFLNETMPISSGPFEFDEWKRSVHVLLKRNPNYWDAGKDDKPYLDHIKFVFIADTNTLKIQLRTGEVDLINPPPDSTLKQELKTFPRGGFQIQPGVYWEQIAFNTSKAPTNDVNVRQAIARSIDRDQITDVVLKKQVTRLDSTILPGQTDYYTPAWQGVKPDPKVAATYLEKSGYKREGQYYMKDGKPLTVLFKSTAGNNLRLKVAQLLQQRLKANGIKMDIALEPPNVFFGQSAVQGAFDMALWAWSSGVDPSQTSLFSCDSIPSEANEYSGQNNYRYCNEDVSRWMKEADVTTSVEDRAELLKKVQTQMAADMPMLPMFQRPETLAYTDRVHGIDDNPLAGIMWNVTDWAVAK